MCAILSIEPLFDDKMPLHNVKNKQFKVPLMQKEVHAESLQRQTLNLKGCLFQEGPTMSHIFLQNVQHYGFIHKDYMQCCDEWHTTRFFLTFYNTVEFFYFHPLFLKLFWLAIQIHFNNRQDVITAGKSQLYSRTGQCTKQFQDDFKHLPKKV